MAYEIRLVSRPSGVPTEDNFELAETELPAIQDGQVRVRNLFMSVDPYMRGRMNDVESYVPPFKLGEAMDGGAVGEVVESAAAGFEQGDFVVHNHGWRDEFVAGSRGMRKVLPIDGVPLSVYLGVLGMPGLTAYAGLLDVAGFKAGDAVFVSGAAGAVGQVVGQIARLKGASRVIGSAGSKEKVALLTDELGFDAAFNYKDGPVRDQLKEAAPDGIDVYFDNVGAEHLEAALGSLRRDGRVALCGAIAVYNATEPPAAPRNLALAIGKRLTLRGFIVGDHGARMPDLIAEVGTWLRDGQLLYKETVVDGLPHAPQAFLAMLRGENTGKMIVRL